MLSKAPSTTRHSLPSSPISLSSSDIKIFAAQLRLCGPISGLWSAPPRWAPMVGVISGLQLHPTALLSPRGPCLADGVANPWLPDPLQEQDESDMVRDLRDRQ